MPRLHQGLVQRTGCSQLRQVLVPYVCQPGLIVGCLLEVFIRHVIDPREYEVLLSEVDSIVGVSRRWSFILTRFVERAGVQANATIALEQTSEICLILRPVNSTEILHFVTKGTYLLPRNLVLILQRVESRIVADCNRIFFLANEVGIGLVLGDGGSYRAQLREGWPLQLGLGERV